MGIEPLNVSVREAARILGCGRSKVYDLINAKRLPVLKLGTRTLLPVAALRAFVAAQAKEAA
jgi:excisionase family DNA binding protein